MVERVTATAAARVQPATNGDSHSNPHHHHAAPVSTGFDDERVVAAPGDGDEFVLNPNLRWTLLATASTLVPGAAYRPVANDHHGHRVGRDVTAHANDDDASSEDSGSSVTHIPLPLERRDFVITVKFALPAVEAEYQRFVYRRGYLRDAVVFLLLCLVFALYFIVSERGAVHTYLPLASMPFFAVAGGVSLALEVLRRRRNSPTAADATDSFARDTRFARARHIICIVGTALPSVVIWAQAALVSDDCARSLAPAGASRYEACVLALNDARVFSIAFIAALVQGPAEFALSSAPSFLAAAVLQWGVVSDRYEQRRDTALQLMLGLLFAALLMGLVAVRDRHARAHFEAIAVAHAARGRTLRAHRETTIAVAALLPEPLARRAARMPGGAGGAGSLEALLPELRCEAAVASVAVTEAADMADFQRRFPNPRMIVLGLCHLFTLFDVGTQVFGVERAGTFGDAYVVTTGLFDDADTLRATVADMARFVLWQLGLDEIVTLPLRGCIVTGRLQGMVLGSVRLPRYTVDGPALALAVSTLKGVPAQQAWVCQESATACGIVTDGARLVGGPGASVSTVSSLSNNGAEARQCFLNVTLGDLVTQVTDGPLVENVATKSMSIAHDGRAGSHYNSLNDTLVRETLVQRQARRTQRAQPQGRTVDDDPEYEAREQQATRKAAVALEGENARDGNPLEPQSGSIGSKHPSDENESDDKLLAATTMAGLWGWRFADAAAEAAFQGERRSLQRTAAVVLALALVVHVLTLVERLVRGDPANFVSGDSPSQPVQHKQFDPLRFLLLALSIVLPLLSLSSETLIHRRSLQDAVAARYYFPLRAGLVVAGYLMLPLFFLFGVPSIARNSPAFVVAIITPLFASNVFDRLPWWLAAAVDTLLVCTPVFSLIFVGDDESRFGTGLWRVLVAFIVCVGITVNIVQRQRVQFAAGYVARVRADTASAASARLAALVHALVPPHMVPQAMRAAGAAALRRQVFSMPIIAAHHTEPSSSSRGDAPSNVEGQLQELAEVLRANHGATTKVDEFREVVVVRVTLRPAAAAAVDPEDRARDVPSSLVEGLWVTVEECLAEANAAHCDDVHTQSAPLSSPMSPTDAAIVRAHGNRRNVPVRTDTPELAEDATLDPAMASVRNAFNAATATLLGVTHDDDDHVLRADPLHHLEDTAQGDSKPLMLVSHLRDSLLIVGPLARGRDRSVAAAGAAARFAALLAERVQQQGKGGVAVGLAVGEAAAALLGRGTMRYGVFGAAVQHAEALALAAGGVSDTIGGVSVVVGTQHFAARYAESGEGALSAFPPAQHAWAVRGLGRVRPHVWCSFDAAHAHDDVCASQEH